jgi:hypothetical protein
VCPGRLACVISPAHLEGEGGPGEGGGEGDGDPGYMIISKLNILKQAIRTSVRSRLLIDTFNCLEGEGGPGEGGGDGDGDPGYMFG